MGILDKLGIKKDKDQAQASGKEEVAASPKQNQKPQTKPAAKTSTGRAYAVLVRPVLSEKGTAAAATGRYVFAVSPRANKTEIKKAIQKVYDVTVRDVKIIKLPGKKRRYGRTVGKTSPLKKAVVVLKAGETIPGIIESVG